ncbi:uncharacterized protein LOC126668456 [Mercurialis annua]|uniref:uncharacterized protein LOC126668456 n=1 Tax=Mercurialis annua TaxID=3986 RepID=UPI0021601CEE|nr:uncharacterized protein LOC126668456 [Mercurialis annua]
MNNCSWKQGGTIPLTESCSSIIQSNLPIKQKDPESFTIPCTIGNMNAINCLCDLGASFNLMPFFLFRSLFSDKPVKHTQMVLQLADHSLKKSYGIVEDVLVKVDKFIFPVDFVILDYVVDKECPMILGRPFMNTGRALIDVHAGKHTLRIDEKKVEFDMKRVMWNTNDREFMRVDFIDKLVEDQLQDNKLLDQEAFLGSLCTKLSAKISIETEPCQSRQGKIIPCLDREAHVFKETCPFELENDFSRVSKITFHSDELNDEYSEEDEPKPEILIKNEVITPPCSKVPPVVEMKPLTPHLWHTFVGENKTLHIIISNKLSEAQEKRVVQVVKIHVLAMEWKISDI